MKCPILAIFCTIVCSTLFAAERPNVLLIVADDLGWSDVCWHGGFGLTPNMDRLVREGRELDRHYVQPVCTPARTALMSGRCPGRFGRQTLLPSNLRAMPLGAIPHSPFNSENDRLRGKKNML